MKSIDQLAPIPPFHGLPKWQEIPTKDNGEPLVCLEEYLTGNDRIVLSPQYYQQGLDKASPFTYMRIGAAQALLKAATTLPEGFTLILYDVYRSPETQQALFDREKENMRRTRPDLSPEDLERCVSEYVAPSSKDTAKPSPHATGGAIDLSILGPNGQPLNMGTEWDALDESSHTAYFEPTSDQQNLSVQEQEVVMNRRLLYQVMAEAGFTNYPGEWWHFDFGNRVHAAIAEKDHAIYGMPHYNPKRDETAYQQTLPW